MGFLWKEIRTKPLNWLLAAVPIAAGLEFSHGDPLWLFLISCIAIVPLAGLMGKATENLSETLGAGIGGLLNATFGNAAELIIALVALWRGPDMYPLVKASLTGSIIGNILLVLGLSIALGGLRHKQQTFNRTAAAMGATLLALATMGLIVPSLYHYLFAVTSHLGVAETRTVASLSTEIAVILAGTYVLSLVFALRTHSHLYDSPVAAVAATHPTPAEAGHHPEWSRPQALGVLIGATVGVAWMSEMLVGSVSGACERIGMNPVFVGVIVVAIIGNAAEHSTAVLMAMKDKMDLAVNIAVGSSMQIALFVAPVLVFASIAMGHAQPLDLHFSPMETIAVVFSVVVLYMVSQDGESNWLEGVMLLATYVVLGLAFYHLPETMFEVSPEIR